MPNSNLQVVSRLLGATVEELDISPLQYELAVRRYSDLGQWLVALGIGDPDVYPQGSFRLGTVVRPTAGGDFLTPRRLPRLRHRFGLPPIRGQGVDHPRRTPLPGWAAAEGLHRRTRSRQREPSIEGARPLLGTRLFG